MVKSWIFKEKGDAGGWVEHPESDLPGGSVLVDVTHSAINYKDALSITGRAPISRKFPMVPGIDVVGTVREDASSAFKPGDRVVATGFGLGETQWGGYTTTARLKPEWLVTLPDGLSSRDAAAVGTAGLTAALAIDALEAYGLPLGSGEIVVSGATGGVGSFALRLLNAAGYHAVAMTGRPEEEAYLKAQGAKDIVARSEFEGDAKPLAKERWTAGIDVAGGKILANILSTMKYGGRRLRPRGSHGPADLSGALHPARRQPARRRLRHGPARKAGRRLEADRRRDPRQTAGRHGVRAQIR